MYPFKTLLIIVFIVGGFATAFAQPQPAKPVQEITIVRLDPRFDKLVPLNLKKA
jgi:hypothetical protein